MYTTETFNGSVVPASAYILWPHTPYVPAGVEYSGEITFPLVAWAHGTTGSFSNCAPSNYQNLQYSFIAPWALASQGFAVVAADYAGLGVGKDFDGNDIEHPWGFGPAQANDVAFAVEAARKAFPSTLSEEFVTIGHSQGGGTAFAFAERQADDGKAVSGYLGTVAIAPIPNLGAIMEAAWANPTNPNYAAVLYGGIQQLSVASANTIYPSYNLSGLTTVGRGMWELVKKANVGLATMSLLIPYDLMAANAGWWNDPAAKLWFENGKNGGKPVKGPFLVATSKNDTTVPYDFVVKAMNDTAALPANKNESIEFKSFVGLDHFPVITGSTNVWMEWIKARFAHSTVGVAPGFKQSVVPAYNINATREMPSPNWLLVPVNASNGFKANL